MSIRAGYSWLNFQDITAMADVRLKELASKDVGWPVLDLWAGDANRKFAAKSLSARRSYTAPIVQSQELYPLPADCLRPDRVSMTWPGDQRERMLRPITELNSIQKSRIAESRPYDFFVSHDKKNVGLYPIPSNGGADVLTTGLGGDTVTITSTNLSTTDDYYNGLEVKILSGDQQGESQTISDYVGSTGTITVDTAFGGAIASGVRIQIHPDSLRIAMRVAGNDYQIKPTKYTIVTAGTDFDTFVMPLPERPENFWEGCEVYFGGLTDTLFGEKTRILTSTSTTAPVTTLNVSPALHTIVAGTETTVTITDVPNTPGSFHASLVDYVVSMGLQQNSDARAPYFMGRFLEGIEEATMRDRPLQGQAFHRVRENRVGEDYGSGIY